MAREPELEVSKGNRAFGFQGGLGRARQGFVAVAVLGSVCLAGLLGLVACESLEAVTQSTTGRDIYVEFRFDGECFVEVHVGDEDGVGVLRGHRGQGDVNWVGGHKVYWMSVDNPDVLRVYVNNVLVADELSGDGSEFPICRRNTDIAARVSCELRDAFRARGDTCDLTP